MSGIIYRVPKIIKEKRLINCVTYFFQPRNRSLAEGSPTFISHHQEKFYLFLLTYRSFTRLSKLTSNYQLTLHLQNCCTSFRSKIGQTLHFFQLQDLFVKTSFIPLMLLNLEPVHVYEGCGSSSSRLSCHISQYVYTSIILLE